MTVTVAPMISEFTYAVPSGVISITRVKFWNCKPSWGNQIGGIADTSCSVFRLLSTIHRTGAAMSTAITARNR